MPGSWPQASVHGGPHAGAAEDGKNLPPLWQVTERSVEGGKLGEMGPTSVTEVVHQDNLGDQLRGRAVQHAVNGAEEGGPALVVEGDDDAGVGERLQVAFAVAARGRHGGTGRGQVQLSCCQENSRMWFS